MDRNELARRRVLRAALMGIEEGSHLALSIILDALQRLKLHVARVTESEGYGRALDDAEGAAVHDAMMP